MSHLPPPPNKPYPEITTRNLICHLYPHKSNDAATRNLTELCKRWHLFNGKKIIALAHDHMTLNHRTIKKLLPPDAEIFLVLNDTRLREAASFPLLLRQVQSHDEHTATFYCHGKGTSQTHNGNPQTRLAITYWAIRMYHHLLDDWDAVNDALRTKSCAGIYKIDYTNTDRGGMTSPTGGPWGEWHYAGSFFWFRHDHIFRNPKWSMIPDDSYAAEAWLGTFIDSDSAATLYQPYPAKADPQPNYYDPKTHGLAGTLGPTPLDKLT
jgi:hypothetical protein